MAVTQLGYCDAMSDAVPAWAYEQAEVCPYDPRWADRARTERERLAALLAPWLAGGVEHAGSTAVPGLAAKPIIDLMAPVSDLDVTTEQVSARLAADGWHYVPPELDQRPWRRFFVKPDASGQRREAHLHLIPAGHPRWSEQIMFRDALRRDRELAQRYEDLKLRLARQHGHDREAYSEGKAQFVAAALAQPSHPGAPG
jgi:GrpB-like predicted nucleotidyltransferase (UPF0157 family)